MSVNNFFLEKPKDNETNKCTRSASFCHTTLLI